MIDELTAAGKSAPDRTTGEDIDRALVENARTQQRKVEDAKEMLCGLDMYYISLLTDIALDGHDRQKYDDVWEKWIAKVRPYERILEA